MLVDICVSAFGCIHANRDPNIYVCLCRTRNLLILINIYNIHGHVMYTRLQVNVIYIRIVQVMHYKRLMQMAVNVKLMGFLFQGDHMRSEDRIKSSADAFM